MQIVGYETGIEALRYDPMDGRTGELRPATLQLADVDEVRDLELTPGVELAYTLSERHCAGTFDGERHRPCPLAEAPYCDVHASTWPCARCTGQCDRPIEACKEEHAVYLAAFAPSTFKVGVTRLHRLSARLREQGADRAAHVHSVSDGRIARRLEREIAAGMPDRVPTELKVDGLGDNLDREAWRDLLEDFEPIEEFSFDYGLDLADRPVVETLLTGTVIGTKGRLLVVELAGGTYAVDLRDLVGHDLETGRPDRDLQASLGAFGRG